MWETSDLQPYMDRVIEHDNDAFAIVTSNGRWFGSVWYKKFNENKNKNCDMPQGLVELNQLDIKSNVDIYIRKSSVACYTSVPYEREICCKNSVDDFDDPFLQACVSTVDEQADFFFVNDSCTSVTTTTTTFDNPYQTTQPTPIVEVGEEMVENTHTCCENSASDVNDPLI